MTAAARSDGAGLRQLRTPRAAAVAGVLFSCLFSASVLLLRSAFPTDGTPGADWVAEGETKIRAATILMPFAGISFLWFVGVVRDRLGALEDRFFSSVFYGSALLFLAMAFVSTAIAAGIAAGAHSATDDTAYTQVVTFGHDVFLQVSNVFGVRMAAVLMISAATIWWRTGLMPKWLVRLTYLTALPLLGVLNLSMTMALVFPAWTLLISTYLLAQRAPDATAAPLGSAT